MDDPLFAQRRRRALAIATVALILGCGLTACGGDDGGDGTAAAKRPAAGETSSDETAPAPERREAAGDPDRGLAGDIPQARAGKRVASDLYESLETAIEDDVLEIEARIDTTLATARRTKSLTRVCDLMSTPAKRELVAWMRRSSRRVGVAWTCETAMGILLRRARQGGTLKATANAEVVGVNANGDTGTATIRFGGPNGRVSSVPLVREDGKWKIGSAPGGGG